MIGFVLEDDGGEILQHFDVLCAMEVGVRYHNGIASYYFASFVEGEIAFHTPAQQGRPPYDAGVDEKFKRRSCLIKSLHPDQPPVNTYLRCKIAISAINFVAGSTTVYNFEVEDYHTYYVSEAKVLVHNSGPCPVKGGVYVLKDGEKVVRTCRIKDLAKREIPHANDAELGKFKFETKHKTDVHAEQRGLEDMLYRKNPSAQSVNGGFNKIKAMSDRVRNSAKGKGCIKAAEKYLKK